MIAKPLSRLGLGLALAFTLSWFVSSVSTQGRGTPPSSPAPAAGAQTAEADLVARARAIHERVIALDTHNDISPNNFRTDCNYTMRLTTQVNLPKMKQGGLDVSFMIAYVGQGAQTPEGYQRAYEQAVEKFDAVH